MIVIARYSFPHEAHMAKASLDSVGIESHILDEHLVNMQWLYSNAIGGVRLVVAEKDVKSATLLLDCDFSEVIEDQALAAGFEADTCPHCGSTSLHPHTQGKRHAFFVFLLLGFPLFFYKNGYLCDDCGEFNEEL